jgi:hypothetical protein
MRVVDDRVKKASAQQLRSQFDRAAFKEGESVEDFILRLNGMVATLGETVEEHVVVEKVLCCVPPRLKQIALAISTLLDVRTLIVANLFGRLKTVEDAFEDPPPALQQDSKLYLTEEEWDARRVWRETERQGSGGAGGSGSSGNGGGRGGGSDRGRGRGRGRSFGGRGPQKTDECRRCGKLGHWAQECKAKAKKDQAHTVQEEEASLMVARVTECQILVKGESAAAKTGGELAAGLVIHEEKVFVQLGKPADDWDAKVWIVDTGATNHMTGSCAAFVDLDTHVRGTVRFDDDSTAEIEGRGRVEFVCKNGELRSFDEVYFIPKLAANIVSVGRLDEDGYQVHIGSGELTIRVLGGKLLARVKRTTSRLYLLLVKLSVKRCLLTKEEAEARRWPERLGHINFQAIKIWPKRSWCGDCQY